MTWLAWAAVIFVSLALWVTLIRPVIRKMPFFTPFFDAVEPIERVLWLKSETILFARGLQLLGGTLSFLAYLGTLDLTPLIAMLPDKHKWIAPLLPLFFNVIGTVQELLRRDTTQPLVVTAMPKDAPIDEVRKVAEAENATKDAVTAIEQGGSSGDGDGGE
jgi:hypothetical protein